jgi:hypothetical protein
MIVHKYIKYGFTYTGDYDYPSGGAYYVVMCSQIAATNLYLGYT